MLPFYRAPFIFCHFIGTGYDVNELIHESGHAFVFYTASHFQRLYEYHRSTPSVNEIHSQAMVLLAFPYMERFFGGQKDLFIRKHLYDTLRVLPYRCIVDEFEHKVYENISLTKT